MLARIQDLVWGAEAIVAIQRFFGRDWFWLFDILSMLGDIQVVVLVFALAFWLSGSRTAYGLVGVVALAGAANFLISHALDVPRPDDPRIIAFRSISIPSFPSGHVVTATAMYGLLAVWRRIPRSLAASLVAAVALSRLYLGVHYPANVLAGVALGSLAVIVYLRLWPHLAGWFSRRLCRFFLLAGMAVVAGAVGAFPLLAGLAKGWQLLGIAAGAGIAVPAQRCYIRHCPCASPRGRRVRHALIGLAGALVILIPAASLGDTHPRVGAALYALLVVWVVVISPLLFARLAAGDSEGT